MADDPTPTPTPDPAPAPAKQLAPGATYNLLDPTVDKAVAKAFADKITALCEEYGIGAKADIPFLLYVVSDEGHRFYSGYGCPACATQDALLAVMQGVMPHHRTTGVTAHDGPPVDPADPILAPTSGRKH